MNVKLFEIRDRATFIPVMAIKFGGRNENPSGISYPALVMERRPNNKMTTWYFGGLKAAKRAMIHIAGLLEQ